MQKPIAEKLKQLPNSPGVYLYKDINQQVIYVGKAKILKNRVRSYFIASENDPPKLRILRQKIFDVEFFITDTEREALLLENNLIKRFNPRYNIRMKDDKTYPYIRITNETFPQVFMTRQIQKDGSKYFGPYTDVYDVKQALRTIHSFFQVRTCRFYMSENTVLQGKHRVCLDYHIKRCAGPCEGHQTKEAYQQIIKNVERFLDGKAQDLIHSLKDEMHEASEKTDFESAAKIRDSIQAIQVFYDKKQKVEKVDTSAQDYLGIVLDDTDACICILKVRDGKVIGKQEFLLINSAFDDQESIFEQFYMKYYYQLQSMPDEIFVSEIVSSDAILHQNFLREISESLVKVHIAKIGEKAKLIKMAELNAKQKITEVKLQRLKRDFIPEGLKSLQRDLKLKSLPQRIECFDNSNIQGTDAVASMTVFLNGKAAPSEYRKFHIKSLPDGVADDFASMYEVVYRRYKRLKDEKKPFPDLIVIDGGKGQLSAAVKALVDLALFPHPIVGLAKRLEEVYIPHNPDPQNIPKTSSANRILQQIRDEAHRFAVRFHRDKRNKRMLQSELLLIDGVGQKRYLDLIRHFGSLKNIRTANRDELIKVNGISPQIAENILAFFQKDKSI